MGENQNDNLTKITIRITINDMKKKIDFGSILAVIWWIILIGGTGWAIWDKIQEDGWLFILLSVVVIVAVYFSIRIGRERREKEERRKRKMECFEDALHIIASDAEEKEIREMAEKVLLDENYDPRADKECREAADAQKELLHEYGAEVVEEFLSGARGTTHKELLKLVNKTK